MSLSLPRTLAAWGTPAFTDTLRAEIAQWPAEALPLQQALAHGSHVADGPHTFALLGAAAANDSFRVTVGILYNSVLAGCSCADDPGTPDEYAEYCVVDLEIDPTGTVTDLRWRRD
jgi:hypothetical protein